ncbi:MAG: type II toxin-antitoxin system VapC family toxin [Chthoniobacteraceae bacterium]
MLIAVDTNVLIELGEGVGEVVEAIEVIRNRLADVRLIAPPTVLQEVSYLADFAEEASLREAAEVALQSLVAAWGIHPINLVPVGHGIVEVIAERLRSSRIVVEDELHDSLILAEAALLDCQILLTSDGHLRGVDFASLKLLLQDNHVSAPLIATPREIYQKFATRR